MQGDLFSVFEFITQRTTLFESPAAYADLSSQMHSISEHNPIDWFNSNFKVSNYKINTE